MKRKKTVQQDKYDTKREYKFDRAMQEAAKRASSHPKPVSMTTRIRDYVEFIR